MLDTDKGGESIVGEQSVSKGSWEGGMAEQLSSRRQMLQRLFTSSGPRSRVRSEVEGGA